MFRGASCWRGNVNESTISIDVWRIQALVGWRRTTQILTLGPKNIVELARKHHGVLLPTYHLRACKLEDWLVRKQSRIGAILIDAEVAPYIPLSQLVKGT